MHITLFISLTKILNFSGAPRGPEKSPYWGFFFEKKSGVQLMENCLIRLDPKSYNFTFLKKNLENFYISHILKESLKIFLEFFQLDMVQTNAHNFKSIWARTLKFETCIIESAEQVHAKDWAADWPRKTFESKSTLFLLNMSKNRKQTSTFFPTMSWWQWES